MKTSSADVFRTSIFFFVRKSVIVVIEKPCGRISDFKETQMHDIADFFEN
jgi:hypothetical protein